VVGDGDDLNPFVDHAIDYRKGKSPEDITASSCKDRPSQWGFDDLVDCVVHGEDKFYTEATPLSVIPASCQPKVECRRGVNAAWLLRVGHGDLQ